MLKCPCLGEPEHHQRLQSLMYKAKANQQCQQDISHTKNHSTNCTNLIFIKDVIMSINDKVSEFCHNLMWWQQDKLEFCYNLMQGWIIIVLLHHRQTHKQT